MEFELITTEAVQVGECQRYSAKEGRHDSGFAVESRMHIPEMNFCNPWMLQPIVQSESHSNSDMCIPYTC